MDTKGTLGRALGSRMRIVKTVVAVFICCAIDHFRGTLPLQSTVAAIICMQPDTQNSVNAAIARIFATLLGSVSAMLVLVLLSDMGLAIPSIPFYLILSLLLIPLISVTVRMGWPSAAALTCIIFLSITLGHTPGSNLFTSALERMGDTLVGIFVALPVNALLPYSPPPGIGDGEGAASDPPDDLPGDRAGEKQGDV